MLKPEELRKYSIEELRKKERELRKELMELRFYKSIGKLDNPARYRQIKRDIARILTIIREKEIGMR